MANPELDTLRAQLLAHGITAPKSWNTARLEKELEKYANPKAATEQSTDNTEEASAGSDIEQSTDNTEEESTPIDIEQTIDNTEEASADSDIEQSTDNTKEESITSEGDDLDESADDAEDLDDNVMLVAVVDFTPNRLKLGRKLPGDKFTVPKEDAEFFVKTDRTCKYHNA